MIDAAELQNAAAARAAVETLLFELDDELAPIQARLEAYTRAQLDELQATLAPVVGRAYEAAFWPGPFDEGADAAEWAPVYRAIRETGDDLSQVSHEIETVAARAFEVTTNQIASILPSTSSIFSTIIGVIGRVLDGLLGSLSSNADFWQAAANSLGSEIESHHDKVSNTLTIIANAIIKTANDKSADPGDVARRLQEYMNRPQSPSGGTVEDYIAILQTQPRFITNLANVAMAISTVFEWLSARNSAFISGVRQAALHSNPTTPLSVSNLVDLLRMKIIGEDFAKDHAKRSGISNELFDLLRRGDERLLDVQPILDLWRRSGDDSALDELYRLGYSPESVAALRTLALAVATPSDVVRFLVRDVFDDGAVTRGGLDEDFEVKYNEDQFRAAGVTKELAQYYWRAHWQIPSPTQGYQMLHRKVLPIEELREMIKLADYAPAYVDKLIAISYLTPGRIDIRRMFEVGILTTREELVHYHELLGYSPEHAGVLADFVIRLKGIADENKADRRFGRIATEIVRAFVVGIVSEVQAREALTGLGFTEDRANLRIAEAEYARQRERADTIRDAIGRRYVRGYATEDQTREALAGYAFDEAEANYLLDGWNLQRELREETDAERQQKDLSKSEIIAGYGDGIISRADAGGLLEALGYDATEAETLLRLADAKESRADAKVVEAAARTLYLNRRRTAEETRAILEGAGLQPERIAALLTRWTVEQEERRPDIGTAQLERMLMLATVSIEEVERRLIDKGYSEQDVDALLSLYGADMSIAEEKLKAQQAQFERREARLREQGNRRLDLTERGQNLGQERFSIAQQGLQERFEEGIESRARLQTERLDTQRTLQAERIAAQTEKDAAALAASRERQEKQIDAQMDRLQLQLDAANKRAEDAASARADAMAQRERLANEARSARDAAQARNLQAQADRQQRNIDAAERRAAEARTFAQGLQDQREDLQRELLEIRAELQALQDIRQEASRIRVIGVQEGVQVRKEQRTAARRDITSADAVAADAELQSIQLQKSAAIADLEARFAALQAEVSNRRQRQALERRQQAERILAASTPATTLLDGVL